MRLLAIFLAVAALWGCAAGSPAREVGVLPTAVVGHETTRLTLLLSPDAGRAYRTSSIAGIQGNVRIQIEGPDLSNPVTAVSTASLDSGRLVIDGAPAGSRRLITLTVLGSDGSTPTAISLRAVADLAAGTQSVEVSPRTTAVGGVFARLIATAPGRVAYPAVDVAALGFLIDQIKDTEPRAAHYALIDADRLADDISDRAGALPGPSAAYLVAPGTVRVRLLGAPESALTQIVVDDPVSPRGTGLSRATSQTGDVYDVHPVLPGTWRVTALVGNAMSGTAQVTVGAGAVATASIDFNEPAGWRPGPSLPVPLGAAGVAVGGSKIYVAGGVTPGGSATDSLYVLDTTAATPAWAKLPGMKTPREGPGIGVLGDVVVVVGGMSVDASGVKKRLESVERYSPIQNTWTAGASLSLEFMAGSEKAVWWGSIASAQSASKIFAFQGIADYGITLSAGADYNPFTDAWDATSSPKPLTPRGMAAAAFLNNRVYLIGGQKPANPTFNQSATPQTPLGARAEVEYLDVSQATRVWRAASPLQIGRAELAAAASPTRLYVAGGVGPGDRVYSSVERFDPASGQWYFVPSMRVPRSSFGLVYVGNRLWAIGGAPSRALGHTGGGSALATDSVEFMSVGDSQ